MDENTEIWSRYYQKALSRPHRERTELAVQLNESNLNIATDCGCGTGSDIEYLQRQGYKVYGYDINPEAVAISKRRFASIPSVNVTPSSFESFHYSDTGVMIANSSLFLLTQTYSQCHGKRCTQRL
jgi:hypothetical protein